MHTFDSRRVHEDLEHRQRQRHIRNICGPELEADIGFGVAVCIRLVIVGAQGCLDQIKEQAQHPVLTEVIHLVQTGVELQLQLLLGGSALALALIALGIETDTEKFQQGLGQRDMINKRRCNKGLAVRDSDLAHIARVRTQRGDLAPVEIGRQHQPVEAVILRLSVPDPLEQIFKYRTNTVNVHHFAGVRLQ